MTNFLINPKIETEEVLRKINSKINQRESGFIKMEEKERIEEIKNILEEVRITDVEVISLIAFLLIRYENDNNGKLDLKELILRGREEE